MPLNISGSVYYSENIDYRLGVRESATGDYRKPLQSSLQPWFTDAFEILMRTKMDVEKYSTAA